MSYQYVALIFISYQLVNRYEEKVVFLFRRKSIKKAFKVASIVLRKNSSSVVLTFIPKYYSLLLGIKLYYYATPLFKTQWRLFNRHWLRKVSWLVDIGAFNDSHVVRQQLQRNGVHDRRNDLIAVTDI